MDPEKLNEPYPAAKHPLLRRIFFFQQIWIMKLAAKVLLAYTRRFRAVRTAPPSYTKRYSSRQALEVRFFLPEDFDPKTSPAPLPLYIHVHGGAFTVATADVDDLFCTSWATKASMVVASVNYSKAPVHKYPVAIHDVAAIARAIISDPALPTDRDHVTIGGFSSGGTLALSATMLPDLKGLVKAAVVYFPLTDWSEFPHEKFAVRLDTKDRMDRLFTYGAALDWGYNPVGQDRRDPLISPIYADPDDLPRYVCIVGAQHDMLCREGRNMAIKLAASTGDVAYQRKLRQVQMESRQGKGTGSTAVDIAIAKLSVPEAAEEGGEGTGELATETDLSESFETERYKWVFAEGMRHAFTDDLGLKETARSERRRQFCDALYADVGNWLEQNVL
jgi:acetyl esterase/lipase